MSVSTTIVPIFLKLREGGDDPETAAGGFGPSSPAIRHADKMSANHTATLLTSEKLGHWNELFRETKLMDIRYFFRYLR